MSLVRGLPQIPSNTFKDLPASTGWVGHRNASRVSYQCADNRGKGSTVPWHGRTDAGQAVGVKG